MQQGHAGVWGSRCAQQQQSHPMMRCGVPNRVERPLRGDLLPDVSNPHARPLQATCSRQQDMPLCSTAVRLPKFAVLESRVLSGAPLGGRAQVVGRETCHGLDSLCSAALSDPPSWLCLGLRAAPAGAVPPDHAPRSRRDCSGVHPCTADMQQVGPQKVRIHSISFLLCTAGLKSVSTRARCA